jgi:aminocarboxymuconate-semialdehyde decarboxylase
MDKHGIDISVIRQAYLLCVRLWSVTLTLFVSPANPWLDFLSASQAQSLAKDLNKDLDDYCSSSPGLSSNSSLRRLFGFGLLPLVPSIQTSSILDTIQQISSLPNLKGVIMGTKGIGKGLDDDALEPIWEAIENSGLVIFLHPHYGVDGKAWGEKDNGHVLPLALGFPFETTIVCFTADTSLGTQLMKLSQATTRLILAGVFDRYPSLRLLLAHSGGALPALSSRLASCIDHDPIVASRLKHDARYYLGKLYYDAVAYGAEELEFVSNVIGRSEKFDKPGSSASASSGSGKDRKLIGSAQLLFGTDHPFFPPLKGSDKWRSVEENLKAIDGVEGWGEKEEYDVKGGNALRLFSLLS